MPELDAVTQTFYADVAPYIAALQEAIDKAKELADATKGIALALGDLSEMEAAATVAAESLIDANAELRDVNASLMMQTQLLSSIDEHLALVQRDVTASSVELEIMLGTLREAYHEVGDAAMGAAVKQAAASAMGGGGVGATGWLAASIAWWQRWQAVIHWAVMGTMEILSTAIPAFIALGAAIVAMAPAFTSLKDHFTNLIVAAGSLSNAVASIPGPMGALAGSMGRLSLSVAPDVWMALGSAISIVTMHTGVFAGIAQKASDVLGNFAAKIVTDLQGPAGHALQGFLQNGVKFMTQWGQVLGQFGDTFLNIFHAMPGVGHVVLDVLDALSRVLATITAIPVVGTLLGIVGALSAVYRYAVLVGRAMQFMWTAFGGQAVATAITNFIALSQAMGGPGLAATFLMRSAMVSLAGAMGIIVPVTGLAIAGLEIWYLNSQSVTEATKQLIQQVLSARTSITNLALGSLQLSTAQQAAIERTNQFSQAVKASGIEGTKTGAGVSAATKELNNDSVALSQALSVEYNRLTQLLQGLTSLGSTSGQVASNMAVLSIQTSMQDSKVQQLNQAWDAYLSLLTGGMSDLANYTTALGNMTSVTATSGIKNLAQSTGTLNLTTAQFQQQLQSGAVQGASAWQNFTQVMTGSLGPIGDYLRQAQAAGVITKTQFAQGIADATAAMIPYTGTTGTAAQMLLAFYRQSGDNVSSLSQVQAAVGSTGSALNNLNGIMTTAAIQMSNAGQVARNMSAIFNQQVTQALVAAALKANGFTTDVANMMQAQKTGTDVAGHDWQWWAQQAANAWNNAQSAAASGAASIKNSLNSIPDYTVKHLQIVTAYTAIGQAPGQGMLRAPTFHGGVFGYAAGGMVAGMSGKDVIPAMLTAGEAVLNTRAVAAMGGPLGIHALNNQPSEGVLTGGGGGRGGGVISITLNNTTTLDGQALSRTTRVMQLTYDRRNPSPNLSLNRPGRPG